MKKLPVFPSMQCDSGCGECCGVIPTTEEEFARVKRFIKVKAIKPTDQGVTCPFYQDGSCRIYPVRPLICQLFGHLEDTRMTCPRGYNVNISTEALPRMFRRSGEPKRILHELLPGFTQEQLAEIIEKHLSDDFSGPSQKTGV